MKTLTKDVGGRKSYTAVWESAHTFEFPRNIEDLRKILHNIGNHYFDPDTRRFFRSRVGKVWSSEIRGKIWFIEPTKRGFNDHTRVYRICEWNIQNPNEIKYLAKDLTKGRVGSMFDKIVAHAE